MTVPEAQASRGGLAGGPTGRNPLRAPVALEGVWVPHRDQLAPEHQRQVLAGQPGRLRATASIVARVGIARDGFDRL